MLDVNGFPRKNPGVIHNSIYMVRIVKRVTVSAKKSAAFCPVSFLDAILLCKYSELYSTD